jgi:OmcA/MtrC family decaheme c-type cytochrome
MVRFRKAFFTISILALAVHVAPLVAQRATGGARKASSNGQVRPHAADQNLINFIRPGISVKVVSAAIASDGTITARVNLSDPKGLPLDMAGIATPGAVTVRLIAAYIPSGQKQFVSYTTTLAKATLNSNPSQTQAATDTGGTWKTNAIGDYTYTFATKAPANFDATVTHAIGVTAQRDLSEFITYAEFAETANDVLNFVPNGSAVKVIRSVVPTSACNNCHNPLIGHGGSRLTVEMCILCHTPQTINPDTKLTQDMNVLIHKIHMGKNLPSVKAGTPYRIWHRGAWSDFSDVGFPSGTEELKMCDVCHQNAPQANNYMTAPSRAACGSCHDNVNFATGENHVNLPQVDDNMCTTCHTPKGELEMDASIKGAHTVINRSTALGGVVLQVQNVSNTAPGQAPTVTFKVADKGGNPIDISKLTYIRVLLSGPNVDYQVGAGGIRVSEDPSKTPGSGGIYTYTMTNKIPAAAAGSYTISLEARNSVNLLPGTVKQITATDAAKPVQFYFSVDKSKMVARRVVVTTAKCAACHADLTLVHGGSRGESQECVLCHNPMLADGTSKQSVSFATQIHSIHRGKDLANPYVLGTTNYQEVGFPGDLRVCTTCHAADTYQVDNVGAVAAVASPGGFTPTTPPIAAACQGCHDDKTTAGHAVHNTDAKFGESCVVCHGKNAEFAVDKVHSRTQ